MDNKKKKTIFVCQSCGYESPKWMGQCICGAWNSFAEEVVRPEKSESCGRRGVSKASKEPGRVKPTPLPSVVSGQSARLDTGIGELNRVLGGGLVKGSLTLISGEPGIGKSTIIIQAAAHIAKGAGPVLYVSGEESEEQIKIRADRVTSGDLSNLYLLSETNMENIMDAAEALKPGFLVIDSIQTMYTDELDSAPGSVSQVRACGNMLMTVGKAWGIPVFIVAHVTKSGDLAGPKIVEHMVDTVLLFSGERSSELRILRSLKNRFGTTSEIGAFEMRREGLTEVPNLSETLLEGLSGNTEGAAASAVYEGTRPLLLEVQALTAPANAGFARRTSIGLDSQRLGLIAAVLERRAKLPLFSRDVYVNIVGGIKPDGTSTDLAAALAIWSCEKQIALPKDMLFIGEIGLTGELRSASGCEKLVKEASRLGFSRVLLPKRDAERLKDRCPGIELMGVTTLSDAIFTISTYAKDNI